MAILFEYGEWEGIKNKNALKKMLLNIWSQRYFDDDEIELNEEENSSTFQPFLTFDGEQVRANNYVGFIQNNEETIEIYPKIFKSYENAKINKELMLKQIFYWLSYCRKWRFPFTEAILDTLQIDEFPELIIYLIASQFLDTVSKQSLSIFQQTEETLHTPRGTINFKRTVNNNYSRGNFQNIDCDYEPFLFDNNVNRVIKYCSRLLLAKTKYFESQRILLEVIFILDDVNDVTCTINDTERISINSFFVEYQKVIDYCKIILSQHLYSNKLYELSQWCLLFPMEYIFEDFIAGFLENKFSKHWKIEYQKSDKYLAYNEGGKKVFNMRHDIFLTSKGNTNLKIIVDTKYKLRDIKFKGDLKRGIIQNDLYQMVSYAYRRGCKNILLIYPNISNDLSEPDKFDIISGFDGKEKITVVAMEVPFWSLTNISNVETKLFQILEQGLNSIIN